MTRRRLVFWLAAALLMMGLGWLCTTAVGMMRLSSLDESAIAQELGEQGAMARQAWPNVGVGAYMNRISPGGPVVAVRFDARTNRQAIDTARECALLEMVELDGINVDDGWIAELQRLPAMRLCFVNCSIDSSLVTLMREGSADYYYFCGTEVTPIHEELRQGQALSSGLTQEGQPWINWARIPRRLGVLPGEVALCWSQP